MTSKWNNLFGMAAAAAILSTPLAIQHASAQVVDRQSVLDYGAEGYDGRISQDLLSIVSLLESLDPEARAEFQSVAARGGQAPMFMTRGENFDLIEVYIRVADRSDQFVDFLRDAGVRVHYVSVDRPLIQAEVPLNRLQAISKIPGVLEISRPEYAIATAGSVVTEGDLRHQTNIIRRSTGIDGTGTTVLVFSNALYPFFELGSFLTPRCTELQEEVNTSRPAGLETELPIGQIWSSCNSVPQFGWFGDIQIFPLDRQQHAARLPAVRPEGAAMLEIVRDIAPGARLLYGNARTSLELEAARSYFGMPAPGEQSANDFAIDVIVDNLSFTGVGRYDGSSSVSRQLQRMSNAINAAYVVTAGGVTPPSTTTMATDTGLFPIQISGFFNGDPRFNVLKTHNWNPNSTVTSRDEALAVRPITSGINVQPGAPPNEAAVVFEATLVWDDVWDDANPRASIDLDMYLVPRNDLSINRAIASSTRLQNGSSSNPVERISFAKVLAPGEIFPNELALIIVNKSVDQNAKPFFTLTIERGALDDVQYLTNPVPLNNSDARGSTISVGNIDLRASLASNTLGADIVPGVSPLNSPTGGFLRWNTSQNFPSVVSFSSVSTRSIPVFTGPSAATAHIGGMVALMRHQSPDMKPDRIRELLTDTSGIDSEGNQTIPLATDVTPPSTRQFAQAPRYLRPNPFYIINGILQGRFDPYAPVIGDSRDLVDEGPDGEFTTDWIPVNDPTVLEFDPVVAKATDRGLELRATSHWSAGHWTSPLLTILDENGEPTTKLRADRVYMVEARIGTDCTSATASPDIRLRLTSSRFDEAANLQIASFNEDISNAPDSVEGKVYRLFYQPSNEAVAADGHRFHFDVLSFNVDKDISCSLILREFTFTELSELESLGMMN